MCGIVGAFGNLVMAHERVVSDLLVMDALRGTDSVGIAAVSHTNVVRIEKSIEPAINFSKQFYQAVSPAKNIALIGHNRAATKGVVSFANAHPFEEGKIVGVHNGTLRAQHLLPDHEMYQVDSQNLFHAIDVDGIVKTWTNLCGAAACAYWDKEKKTLNIARNSERPLYLIQTKKKDAIFFCSEFHMGFAACYRQKVEVEELAHTVAVNTLYSFSYDSKEGISCKKTPLEACKYVPPAKTYYYYPSTTTYTGSYYDFYDHHVCVKKKEEKSDCRYKRGDVVPVIFYSKSNLGYTTTYTGYVISDEDATVTCSIKEDLDMSRVYFAMVSYLSNPYSKKSLRIVLDNKTLVDSDDTASYCKDKHDKLTQCDKCKKDLVTDEIVHLLGVNKALCDKCYDKETAYA